MRLLGMQVFPKRKTDDEYINSIRKFVSRSRWFGLFFIVGVIFFIGLYCVIWGILLPKSIDFPFHLYGLQSSTMVDLAKSGFHIGVMLGAVAGIDLFFAFFSFIWAMKFFSGQRTEHLLLKFYDELKEKKELPKTESTATNESSTGESI